MIYLLVTLISQIICCPFTIYEEGLMPQGIANQKIKKTIQLNNLEQTSFSFGIWSFPQISFDQFTYLQQIFTIEKYDTKLVYVDRYVYYNQYNVSFNFQNHEEINFIYQFSKYLNQWIFTLITLTNQLKTMTIEMTGQQSFTTEINIFELNQQYDFIIGNNQYIEGEILSQMNFIGRLSLPIFFDNIQYTSNSFLELSEKCKIPNQIEGIQKVEIISGMMIFNAQSAFQMYQIYQYGKKYCISGWGKYDIDSVAIQVKYIYLRVSKNPNKLSRKTYGDELFKLEGQIYKYFAQNTKIRIVIDLYCQIDQTIDPNCEVDYTGMTSNYQPYYEFILQNQLDDSYYQGLQKWHFFQYEYGKESEDGIEMLFQIQFSNSIGYVSENLINNYLGSLVNTQMYIFLGEKDNIYDFLYAQLANINFISNYEQDQEYLYYCHQTCYTCNGPLMNNCLSCLESQNRYYNNKLQQCLCNDGYRENYQQNNYDCISLSELYPFIKNLQIPDSQDNQCPLGYFTAPVNEFEFQCIQCPQQSSYSILCADCWFDPINWYLKPTCTKDFISRNKQINDGYLLTIRKEDDIDLYIIDENYKLIQMIGYSSFCDESQQNINCYQVNHIHLNKKIYVTCKPNFYYSIDNCYQRNYYCVTYDNNGDCQSCDDYQYIKNGRCYQCPDKCEKCQYDILTDKVKCLKCQQKYGLFYDECQSCGAFCLICKEEITQDLDQIKYLKCLKCFDDSLFLLTADQTNCIKNEIIGCRYALQFHNNKIIQSYKFYADNYKSDIVTICALCNNLPIYNQNNKACEPDPRNLVISNYQNPYQCLFYLNNDEYQCIMGENSQLSKVWTAGCYQQIENCRQCLRSELFFTYSCLICNLGFYADRLSGQCLTCPNELNCILCGQQQIIEQDYWVVNLRPFIGVYIESYLYDFSQNQQSQNIQDYEVICLSCQEGFTLVNGKCITSCPDLCEECELVNNQFICVKCIGSNNNVQQSIVDNKCLQCPMDCSLCRQRTQTEINQINPTFQDEKYIQYSYQCLKSSNEQFSYYDNQIGRFIQCESKLSCQNQLVININLICSRDIYDSQLNFQLTNEQKSQFKQNNILITDLFSQSSFSQFENDQFYDFANQKSIKYIQIIINSLSEQTCELNQFSQINQQFSQHIFSLIKTEFIFSFDNKVKFIYSDVIQINDFSNIIFNNVTFVSANSASQKKIIFNSVFQQVITLKNIDFYQLSEQNDYTAIIFKSASEINLQNINIINFHQNSQNYTFYITKNTQNQIIKIQDFQIKNSFFFNQYLFLVDLNLQDLIQLKDMVVESSFINTYLIGQILSNSTQSYQQNNLIQKIGYLEMFNILIMAKIQYSNGFLQFQTFQKININQFQVKDTILKNSSLMSINPNFEIIELQVQDSTIFQGSNIIQNNEITNTEVLNLKFLSIKFLTNQYDPQSNFIILKKLNSINQNIYFDELILQDNRGTNSEQIFIGFQYSLISLESSFIEIKNLNLVKGYGITELFIKEAQNFTLSNSNIELGEKFQFKWLHQNFNCILNNNKYQTFVNAISIYSTKFVFIEDLNIQNLQITNSPIISFKSADLEIKVQKEIFIMERVHVQNTLILQTYNQLIFSVIQIRSSQNMDIQLSDFIFENNILHSSTQNSLFTSSLLINVDCPNCKTVIQKSNFRFNMVSNSTDSIIYIRSKNITISDCTFDGNNLFNYSIIKPHLLWGFQQENVFLENVKDIFSIKSLSGNGILMGEKIHLQNIIVQFSSGQSGGGFQIIAQDNSKIIILNSNFFEIKSLFSQNIEQGAVINIDGTLSQTLSLNIQKLVAQNIFCKNQGGVLYFKSSDQNVKIQIKNIELSNIFSEQGSFIYFQFISFSTKQQNMLIEDIKFSSSQAQFERFLQNFNVFLQNDINLLQNNRSIIYIDYGTVLMFNRILFSESLQESLIDLNGFQQAILENITSLNSQFNNFLIRLYPFQSKINSIIMKQLTFTKISQNQQKYQYQCYALTTELPKNSQVCKLQIIDHPLELEIYESKEKRKEYQQACLSKIIESEQIQTIQSLLYILDVTDLSKIVISNIVFKNIICDDCLNGLLFLLSSEKQSQNNQNIQISNIIIESSRCGFQGCFNFQGVDYQTTRLLMNENEISKLNSDLEIENMVCQNNTSYKGGCLNIVNFYSVVKYSIFSENQAKQGGALYLSGKLPIILIECAIKQNLANEGGGIYFEGLHLINYKKFDNYIEGNHASFQGNDFKVLPEKINLEIGKNQSFAKKTIFHNDTLLIEQIEYQDNQEKIYLPSGQELSQYQIFNKQIRKYSNANLIFRIQALQFDDNVAKNLNDSFCSIKSRVLNTSETDELQEFTNNFTNLKQIVFDTKTQNYNLDNLIIYFDSELQEQIVLQLEFECNSIKIPVYELEPPFKLRNFHNNYRVRVNLKSLACQYGEIKNLTDNSCRQCDSSQGFFSLQLKQQKCELKDEISTLNVLPALLELKQEYWRPYFETSKIEYCQNLPANCLGGWIEGDDSCILGHIGALCEQCDVYNIRGDGNFAQSEKYYCNSCNNQSKNVVIIILTIIWTFATLFISVTGNLKMLDEYLKPKLGYQSKLAANLNKSYTGVLIKMLTNYFQIIASLTTFQLNVPISIESFLNIVGNPIQTSANSQDCFLINFFSIQIHYSRSIWLLTMPLFYISSFLIFYFVSFHLKIMVYNSSIITTAFIHIFLYFQPNIVGSLMQLLSFKNISEYKWIKANVAFRYDTEMHYKWILQFVLPFLLIFAILIPLFLFSILFKYRDLLEKKQIRIWLGYIYHEYKLETYYWEIIKVMVKQFIIIFLNFYEEDVVIKGILVLLITTTYQELNINYKPYQFQNLNNLDYSSTYVCSLSVGLAIGLYVSQNLAMQELEIPFLMILAFFNFRFLLKIIHSLILQYIKTFSQSLDSIYEFIIVKVPFLQKIRFVQNILKKRSLKQQRIKILYSKLQQYLIPLVKQSLQFKNNQQKCAKNYYDSKTQLETLESGNFKLQRNFLEIIAMTNLRSDRIENEKKV